MIIKPNNKPYSDFIETHEGSDGKKGRHNFCFLNSRQEYFKRKENGEDVKYVEGKVFAKMEMGEMKWIEHAWILLNNEPYDPTYGKNDSKYKGTIIKDELMKLVPKWMHWCDEEEDYKNVNISVKNQYKNLVPIVIKESLIINFKVFENWFSK